MCLGGGAPEQQSAAVAQPGATKTSCGDADAAPICAGNPDGWPPYICAGCCICDGLLLDGPGVAVKSPSPDRLLAAAIGGLHGRRPPGHARTGTEHV